MKLAQLGRQHPDQIPTRQGVHPAVQRGRVREQPQAVRPGLQPAGGERLKQIILIALISSRGELKRLRPRYPTVQT